MDQFEQLIRQVEQLSEGRAADREAVLRAVADLRTDLEGIRLQIVTEIVRSQERIDDKYVRKEVNDELEGRQDKDIEDLKIGVKANEEGTALVKKQNTRMSAAAMAAVATIALFQEKLGALLKGLF